MHIRFFSDSCRMCLNLLDIFGDFSLRTYRRRRVHTVLGSSWPPSVSRPRRCPHVRGAHQRNLEATWLDKSWPGPSHLITGPSQETKETACRFKLQEVHVATCDVSKYLYFFLHDTAKKKSWKVYLILADRWQSSILAVSCGSWILGNPSLTSNDNKIVLLPLVLVDSSDLRLSVTVDTCCQAFALALLWLEH